MQISYWEREAYLSGMDVVIVGSGLVGLSAAIELKQQNPRLSVTIIERSWLSAGASSKNAGFTCFGSLGELVDDLNQMDENTVKETLNLRWKGLKNLRSLLGDKQMDYQERGSLELFSPDEKEHFKECEARLDEINAWVSQITGKNTYKISHEKIRERGFKGFDYAIENSLEGQIDTGKMLNALLNKAKALGVKLINGVEVFSFQENTNNILLETSIGELSSQYLIIANNGFASRVMKGMDIKPARAQVLITEEIPDLKWQGTFHFDRGYYYFRNVGKRILFGGGRNLDVQGETTTDIALSSKIQAELDTLLSSKILPGRTPKIEMRWAGIMGIGNTKKPIVKALGNRSVCAVRMGGMGIAIGSLIGAEAARLLVGNSSDSL